MLLIIVCFLPLAEAKMQGGSIQFMKPKAIAIHRQDVTLSLDKITSNYVFVNNSALEIIETIVFPAPYYPQEKKKKFKEQQQFNQLKIIVDGRDIEYKNISLPISMHGEDLSEFFKSLGISGDPTQIMASINSNENSRHIRNALVEHKLIDSKTNTPLWNNKTYYYWQQKFPPAQEVHVCQTYKPNLKIYQNNIQYKLQKPSKHSNSWLNKLINKEPQKPVVIVNQKREIKNLKDNLTKSFPYIKQFCPANADYLSLLHSVRTPWQQKLISRELQYNLINNDNWSNAIDYFTLKIEHPENIPALSCWPHKFEHSSPTTLIFSATNYIPTQDIAILFLQNR